MAARTKTRSTQLPIMIPPMAMNSSMGRSPFILTKSIGAMTAKNDPMKTICATGLSMSEARIIGIGMSRASRINRGCFFRIVIRFPAERIGHPRRGGKPEFKLRRYPPLDEPACSICFFRFASHLVPRTSIKIIANGWVTKSDRECHKL